MEPKTYFTGRAVKKDELPEATGGDPPLRYTLELAPLAGLIHEPPATGARHGGTITGTPTKPTARQEYTLTATDKNGDKATLPFTIEVKPDIQNRDLALVLAGVGRTPGQRRRRDSWRPLRLLPSLPPPSHPRRPSPPPHQSPGVALPLVSSSLSPFFFSLSPRGRGPG